MILTILGFLLLGYIAYWVLCGVAVAIAILGWTIWDLFVAKCDGKYWQ